MAASAPIGGRRTSPGAAVAAARPAGASPGAIGYRFSCLSLGAPGERGLHRPAGAPVSISPLSPHRRGSLGAIRPSWAGGRRSADHLQGQPRGKGIQAPGSRQQASWGSLSDPLPNELRIQVQAGSLSLQSPRHSRNHNKNKSRKRPPQHQRRWSRAL